MKRKKIKEIFMISGRKKHSEEQKKKYKSIKEQ